MLNEWISENSVVVLQRNSVEEEVVLNNVRIRHFHDVKRRCGNLPTTLFERVIAGMKWKQHLLFSTKALSQSYRTLTERCVE